ncbi:hypothetical protein D9M69_657280 [compost metagenome]
MSRSDTGVNWHVSLDPEEVQHVSCHDIHEQEVLRVKEPGRPGSRAEAAPLDGFGREASIF